MDFVKEIHYLYYRLSLHELHMMNGDDYYNGLSYNSLLYLSVISQMETCTVSTLADAFRITKSGVTIKINELVKKGAIVKTQSTEDKRVFYLSLSPQINETFQIYYNIFGKIEQKIKEKYTKQELEQFSRILRDISDYDWEEHTK